jgi:hypothetical protein
LLTGTADIDLCAHAVHGAARQPPPRAGSGSPVDAPHDERR